MDVAILTPVGGTMPVEIKSGTGTELLPFSAHYEFDKDRR